MENEIFSGWIKWIFVSLVIIGIFLRVPFLNDDVSGDHAVNSYRAFGWHDSFVSGQVGPFDKLGHTTWWSGLSFQDAPPVSFLVQKVFFSLFGLSDWVARIPFMLSGIFAAIVFFCWFPREHSKIPTIVGTTILLISSYPVLTSISGYIEGMQLFFVTCSLLFGIRLIKGGGTKALYLMTFFTALALATKYTALFLIPMGIIAVVLSLVSRTNNTLTYRQYAISGLIFIGVLLPVIVYNIQLLKFAGHLDSALSPMLGITSDDFGPIKDRTINLSIFDASGAVIKTFFQESSIVILILLITSMVFLVWSFFRKKDWVTVYCILTIVLVILMLAFTGGGRYVPIAIPACVIAIGWATFVAFRDYRSILERISRKTFVIAFIIFVAFEHDIQGDKIV